MQKITAADPESKSLDIASENLAKLRELFPELVTEGKDGAAVNVDVLKALVGEKTLTDVEEKYGLNWHGKRKARQLALTPSTGTLRPCPDDSVDWDSTKNLMIEGDNLEVLKLLQKSYAGKVKLIYIDPPYNTGKDFVYPDDFRDNIRNYQELTGQVGDQGIKVSTNSETSGRFHTDWLRMIYPRIQLAKTLLDRDGFICVSISDVELDNLRLMLDEVFGSENFINLISIVSKVAAGASGGGEDKRLKKNIEYVLIYARSAEEANSLAHLNTAKPLMDVVAQMREDGESWKYTSILISKGERTRLGETIDGDGNPIEIFKYENVQRSTVARLIREEGLSEEEIYRKYLPQLFSDTNAQTSIRTRVISFVGNLEDGELLEVQYVPRSGKEKGRLVSHFYISNTVRRVIWLSDVAELVDEGR